MDRHKDSDYGRGHDSRNERIENVQCSDAEAAVAKHFEESLRRVHLLQSSNPEVIRNFQRHHLNTANNSNISINPVITPLPHVQSVLVRKPSELLPSSSERSLNDSFKPTGYHGYVYPTYSPVPHVKPVKVLPAPPKLISTNHPSSQIAATAIPVVSQTPSVIVSMTKSPYNYHANSSKHQLIKHAAEAEKYKKETGLLIKSQTLTPLHHHDNSSYVPHRQITSSLSSNITQPNVSMHYNAPNLMMSQIKSKISSPAPTRIYGQPNNPPLAINSDLPIRLVTMKSKPQSAQIPMPQVNYQKGNSSMMMGDNAPPPAHQSKFFYVPNNSLLNNNIGTNSSYQISHQLHPLNLGMPERKRLITQSAAGVVDYNVKKNKIEFSHSSQGDSAMSLVKERAHPAVDRNVLPNFGTSISPSSASSVVSLRTQTLPQQSIEISVPNNSSWTDRNTNPINFFGRSSQNTELSRSSVSTISKTIPSSSTNTTGAPIISNTISTISSTSVSSEKPPRNLKKAWLQRHTGKNYESTSGGGESNSSCAFTSLQSTGKQPSISGYSSETNRSNDSNQPTRYDHKTKRKSKKSSTAHSSLKERSTDDESSSDKDTNTDSSSGCDKKIDAISTSSKFGKDSSGIMKKIKRRRKIKRGTMAHRRTKSERDAIKILKKSGESFLQNGSCYEVAGKLSKCRECRYMQYKLRSKNSKSNVFCRFFAFRRLKYKCNAQLSTAGFSNPHHDATVEDINIWMPNFHCLPTELNLQSSLFILSRVGDQFCNLWQQECLSLKEHMNDDKTVAWKKVVQGVRELCDVCETTLFNYHWTCGKCGFVVCVDCYKDRKINKKKDWSESQKNRDAFSWLLCTTKFPHEQQNLMLTQIIAGNALETLAKRIHEMRTLWKIPQQCNCELSRNINVSEEECQYRDLIDKLINDELLRQKSELSEINDDSIINCGDIEEFLKATTIANDNACSNTDELTKESATIEKKKELDEDQQKQLNELKQHLANENKISEKQNGQLSSSSSLPMMTCTYSKLMYNKVPHSWLCGGRLLRLHDPKHIGNINIFKDQWKNGQPVVVSGVSKLLNASIWTPESFCADFGDERNDLINCMNGKKVPNQPMKCFWEGFECIAKRLVDRDGTKMLLKLKDWPPAEDFAQSLPRRYNDLIQALPLNQYTQRSGGLNIAGRVPEIFVRPDLGPKMYSAYGSAFYPDKGTTNLHLDISDAVNVMIYVGLPKDVETDEHIRQAFRAIDEAGCDILMRRRIRENNELPGAIWHIYSAEDTSKIRDLLNRVTIENGNEIEADSDPIHDQNFYLDRALRERLYKDYGVQGYSIAQCLGDAVFIPAGSPHQVRNLHNCIKVAQDFVSPENVTECFRLTQEFRALSDAHSNHEDKLQIKNIIYHAVKDATAYLTNVLIQNQKDVTKIEKPPPPLLLDNIFETEINLTSSHSISQNIKVDFNKAEETTAPKLININNFNRLENQNATESIENQAKLNVNKPPENIDNVPATVRHETTENEIEFAHFFKNEKVLSGNVKDKEMPEQVEKDESENATHCH